MQQESASLTLEALKQSGSYEQQDLFDSMYKGLQAKLWIMRQYPDWAAFVMRAYYEKDPEVCEDIQKSIKKHASFTHNARLLNLNPEQFIPGLDLKMMYQDMYWASEGYLWEKMQRGEVNVDEMGQEFTKLLDFWKSIYLRK